MNQFIVVDQDSGIVRRYEKPVSGGMGFIYPMAAATIHSNPNTTVQVPVSVYLPPGKGIDTMSVTEITFSFSYDQTMLDISPTKVAQRYAPPPGWTYKSSSIGADTLEVTIEHTPGTMLTGDSLYLGSFRFDTYLGKYSSTLVYLDAVSILSRGRKFSFCTNIEGALITRVIIDTVQEAGVIPSALADDQLEISPNPASGEVRVLYKSNQLQGASSMRVLDILGREVYQSNGLADYVIPAGKLAKGSYVIEVSDSNKKLIGRVIIQ
jgi:hypothetical protein